MSHPGQAPYHTCTGNGYNHGGVHHIECPGWKQVSMRHRHVVVAAILLMLLMPLATMQQPAWQCRDDREPSGSPVPYTPETHGEADTGAPVTHITASSWYDHGRQEAALLRDRYAPYVRGIHAWCRIGRLSWRTCLHRSLEKPGNVLNTAGYTMPRCLW